MMAGNEGWGLPPANLGLSNDEVHVWRACLAQPAVTLKRLAQTLSADEQRRAERFYFERHRRHFIVARGVLRVILGHYLGLEPHQVRFTYGAQGKPALVVCEGQSSLDLNLSHSQELALYAVTRRRQVGVDVECIRPIPDAEQIAARTFSAQEYRVWRTLPEATKQEAFFNCWTRKEAYVKAIGDGLRRPLDQFDVSLAPGEPAELLNIAGHPEEAAQWSIQELRSAPGYAAALAVKGHGWHLMCWQWVGSERPTSIYTG
jgi:4'-phosphopantetheinyl transferase